MGLYKINFAYEAIVRYNATVEVEADSAAEAAVLIRDDYKKDDRTLEYNCSEDTSVPLEYEDIVSMEIAKDGEIETGLYVGKSVNIQDIIDFLIHTKEFTLNLSDGRTFGYSLSKMGYSSSGEFVEICSYFLNDFISNIEVESACNDEEAILHIENIIEDSRLYVTDLNIINKGE